MLRIEDIKIGAIQDSQYVIPFRVKYVQNGVSKVWDLVKSHGSVAVIIFNISRNVLVCVKQFRPGVYLSSIPDCDKTDSIDTNKYPPSLGVTLEFCAGIIDKNKPLEEIAAEEVLEECGYKVSSSKLERIQSLRCSIGISGNIQTLYYVEVDDSMKVSEGGGVETELIEAVELSLDEGRQILASSSPTSPGEFLYGLLWFYHNKCPNNDTRKVTNSFLKICFRLLK
ncbi:uridine diphosphate glucose pyrophosphatase NUDT14-like [Halyomorpha halys]|uniref:uridine diphosphate glucose pyrophosphatase NUDT14-like n=1 Tax=Halyomorpha halys TaxID=286706 RepID=UPI0006D4C7D6|nr:uridine diphosphate glucose pyrophosphatase-like [Halyomorpha halys]